MTLVQKITGALLPLLFITTALFASVPTYDNKTVDNITIVPHKIDDGTSFDIDAVCSRLRTKVGQMFSQSEFDTDLKTLSKEFATIDPSLKVVDDAITITINLWPKSLIKSIQWHGNEGLKTSKLKSELNVALLSIYNADTFNTAFHKVQNYYIKQGYFESELSYKVIESPDSNEVDIEITVEEGRSGKIKSIRFYGATKQEEHDIIDIMHIKEHVALLSWFTGTGIYQDESVEHDKLVIINYLQNNGYADASADITVSEAKQKERIYINININKGSIYNFDALTFSGNKAFSNEIIAPLFLAYTGDAYSPDKIRETAQNITDFYGKRGYIDAYASPQPCLDRKDPKYSVHFSIEEGARYRVGLVKVFGNTTTQTKIILHESLIIPGEIFNVSKLQKTEERLHNIGYFKNVNVYAVHSSDSSDLGPDFRDIHIEVEETSTGSLGFSFGFSSSESIFGGIDILERNFNYMGIPNIFSEGYQALRGAGEYAHLRADIGTKQRSYLASWTKPFFMDTQWTVGFDLSQTNNRAYSKDYDVNTFEFGIHGLYTVNQYVRVGTHYRLRDSDIAIKSLNPSKSLQDEVDHSGIVSAVSLSLTYDSTNNPIKPTNGFRSQFDAEYAGLGGDYFFLKFAYLNSYYYPLTKNSILKYRVDLQFIQPMGSTTAETLPIGERLVLGGETTVRGFRSYSIGPKYPNGDAHGGISSMLVSLEYLYSISKKVDLFTFLDGGNVSSKEYDVGNFYSSAGFGCRIEIFPHAPPIAIGMGFPFNAEDRSDVRKFFISLGARF